MNAPLSIWKGETMKGSVAWIGEELIPAKTMRDVVEHVARKHKLTYAQMRSTSRKRPIAWARQEAMWHLVEMKRWSLVQIAGAVGVGDHTTVIHGARRFAQRQGLIA